MKIIGQLLISLGLLAGGLSLWIMQVPSAVVYLDKMGLAAPLGLHVDATQTQTAAGNGRGAGVPVAVIVAPVREGKIDDRLEAIGDGRSLHEVTLRSEVAGVIVDIPVASGSFVHKDDVIVRLEDEAEQIAVERAQLDIENATEDVERLSRLGQSGAVTAVTVRDARNALRAAELALRQAQFELDQRTVTAPLSGWMGVLDLAAGDRMNAQDVIASITDRSTILIDFRVPERAVAFVKPGMDMTVQPLGLPGVELEGTVRAIDNVVDSESRTLRVQGQIDNSDDRLRAGMALSVAMRFAGESLPSVDPLAVQWSGQGSFVWAVRQGRAVQVPVIIRQRNARTVVVEAALSPGELVVTEGIQNLRPGVAVNVPADPVVANGDATWNEG